MNNIFRFSAGELAFGILKTNEGISLHSLRDKAKGKRLLSVDSALFTFMGERLSDSEKVIISSDKDWSSASVIKTENGVTIILSGNKVIPNVTVTLTAIFVGNSVEWQTQLSSSNEEYTIISLDHPVLSFDTGKDVRIFFPYGSGEVYSTEKERDIHNGQNYPSYGISMQYMAFYNDRIKRGIYYGIHDPAPAYKRFSIKKNSGEEFMTMVARQTLCGIDKGCNSQTLYGKCVWRLFDGDWYDAAVIYREWAEANAEFLKSSRKEPEWFLKAPHWWLVHIKDDASFADDIIEATKTIGIESHKSPIHLYLWHNAPFDNDYPHYFPVRPHAKEGVKKLQEAGFKVMPYINGRLWDTRDKLFEDFQFTSHAKPSATKDRHGVCFTETYSAKELDGSLVTNSIMCPSTAVWQDKMTYTVGRLINEEGFDGVYMDQIAAAQPYACCDPTHPHPAGGGDWWCRSYRALLDKVYLNLPEDAMLTTECTADPFISHMGGYLSWLWVRNEQVPAFPVIYSKYVTLFGRAYQSDKDEDYTGMRIFIAQSLVYGEQLGWLPPKYFMSLPYRDFYSACVRVRDELTDYFVVGTELLRPPMIETKIPRLRTEKCNQAINGIVDECAVMGCIRRKADGKRLALFVNASKEGGKATIKADIPDGVYGEFRFKNGKATVKFEALSLKWFEF